MSSSSEPIWDSDISDSKFSTDECVCENTTYHCPACGNDSYGDIHDDCFDRCSNCSYYFYSGATKRLKKEGHQYDNEYLCKNCYYEALEEASEEEDPPDVKEVEEEKISLPAPHDST